MSSACRLVTPSSVTVLARRDDDVLANLLARIQDHNMQ